MSAFISTAGANSLAMLTDGAAYDKNGVILRISRKVTLGREVPIAVTTRGNALVGDRHQVRLCALADRFGVDAAIERFEEALPTLMAPEKYGEHGLLHWHILAFSETRGLIRLSAHNIPGGLGDEPPLKLREVSENYAAGNKLSLETLVACGVQPIQPGEDRADFLARQGENIMEAMRITRSTPLGGAEGTGDYIVGGLVDLTIVTEERATVMILKAWDDRVGEKIDPFRTRDAVQDFSGMNRQQRRAAMRAGRKAA